MLRSTIYIPVGSKTGASGCTCDDPRAGSNWGRRRKTMRYRFTCNCSACSSSCSTRKLSRGGAQSGFYAPTMFLGGTVTDTFRGHSIVRRGGEGYRHAGAPRGLWKPVRKPQNDAGGRFLSRQTWAGGGPIQRCGKLAPFKKDPKHEEIELARLDEQAFWGGLFALQVRPARRLVSETCGLWEAGRRRGEATASSTLGKRLGRNRDHLPNALQWGTTGGIANQNLGALYGCPE